MQISSAGGPANGTYGVEIGGGSGHGSFAGPTGAITTTGGAGSTYNLYSSGTVYSVSSLASQTVGSIWKGATFFNGVNGTEATQINQYNHGTSAGTVELQIDLASLLGTCDPTLWANYTMEFTWGRAAATTSWCRACSCRRATSRRRSRQR